MCIHIHASHSYYVCTHTRFMYVRVCATLRALLPNSLKAKTVCPIIIQFVTVSFLFTLFIYLYYWLLLFLKTNLCVHLDILQCNILLYIHG